MCDGPNGPVQRLVRTSACLSVCVPVCVFVACLCSCLSVNCLSVCVPVCLFIVSLSVSVPVCVCCPSVCLSVCVFVACLTNRHRHRYHHHGKPSPESAVGIRRVLHYVEEGQIASAVERRGLLEVGLSKHVAHHQGHLFG